MQGVVLPHTRYSQDRLNHRMILGEKNRNNMMSNIEEKEEKKMGGVHIRRFSFIGRYINGLCCN